MDYPIKKILLAMLGVSLLIAAATAGWYIKIYRATPSYAVRAILESAQNHDLHAFLQHVDLDSLLSGIYDDLIQVSLEEARERPEGNNLDFSEDVARDILAPVKPQFIEESKKRILTQIAGAEITGAQPIDNMAGHMIDHLISQTDIQNTAFVRLQDARRSGNTADVIILIKNSRLDEEFPLHVKMIKIPGTWKVTEIDNIQDYIRLLDSSGTPDSQTLQKTGTP
jgi:hypothetical protein